MKKIVAIFLAFVLLIFISSCSVVNSSKDNHGYKNKKHTKFSGHCGYPKPSEWR